MSRVLHGIHLSDTHIGPSDDFEVRGACPRRRLDRMVKAILDLDFEPDFIIHTGDVVNDPDPAAYAVAKDALAPLIDRFPFYAGPGNHDDSVMMKDGLPMSGKTPLVKDAGRLAYRFDLPEFRGFVLDANVPAPEEPHGELPENQLAALEAELNNGDETPFAVFVHYQPFEIHSAWIDEYLPIRNGEALHELLRKQPPGRVRGVFFGHLHRPVQLYRDGILYSGISSPVCEFTAGVHDEKVGWSADCPVVFHHLSFSPTGTVIKAFTAS